MECLFTSRRSVKKYQRDQRIPTELLNEIFRLTSYAPSSWNLQHWKFIVIQEQQQKERILPITFNQEQVVECSALIVVVGDLHADLHAEKVCSQAVQEGFMTVDIKDKLVGQIKEAYATRPHYRRDEAVRNSSLAAMQLMLVSKMKGLDTCAIGGFDADKLVQELNIPERYLPVMLITMGYAQKPGRPTVRLPLSELIVSETYSLTVSPFPQG